MPAARGSCWVLIGPLVAAVLTAPRAYAQPCDPHWSSLGAGTNEYTRCLAVFDDDGEGPNLPALYVGGQFTAAGGIPANHIAKWNGATWSTLGSGMNDYSVFALAVFDDDGDGPNPSALYAAGTFTTAGGVPANRIAKWNGSTWSALGSGVNDWIWAMIVWDDDGPGPHAPALYVGGHFGSAGGKAASRIAKWDGSSWSAVGGGVGGASPKVYAFGIFDDDGDGPRPPALYVGGFYSTAGGVSAKGIARWDGTSWSPLGSGIDYDVTALAVFDEDGDGPAAPALCVGGMFWSAGGVPANRAAKWDGSSWSALGSGVNDNLHGLTVFDDDGAGPHPPALYAGGYFTTAGGLPANHVAKWNGSRWYSLDEGTNHWVYQLLGFDLDGEGPNPPALYVVGRFTSAGGVDASRVAAWTSCARLGDLNCDGEVDGFDVSAFTLLLTVPAEYAAAYPECDPMLGDIDGSHVVDMADVPAFVDLLLGG